MIEWQQSLSNHQVPVIHGQALASLRAPVDEAEKWLRLQKIKNGSTIALLGFGCGIHAQLLRQTYPDCKLVIYELHAELNIPTPNCSPNEIDQVLEFRPAWGTLKSQYQELRDALLGDYSSFQEFISTLAEEDIAAGKIIQEFIR